MKYMLNKFLLGSILIIFCSISSCRVLNPNLKVAFGNLSPMTIYDNRIIIGDYLYNYIDNSDSLKSGYWLDYSVLDSSKLELFFTPRTGEEFERVFMSGYYINSISKYENGILKRTYYKNRKTKKTSLNR